MIERLLTAAELADLLGFAAGTIVDWVEQGKIPALKLGGRWRFRESEILDWLEKQRVGPGAGGEVSPTPTALPVRDLVFQASPAPHGGGSHAS